MRVPALALSLGLAAGPALAHPHVFVDTGLQILFDDAGRVEALRVVWVYDELYSLLILDDRGLDSDYDGVLTEAEIDDLAGFDMNWEPGFDGDTHADLDGAALDLSHPVEFTADFREGRIVTTHTRRFDTPVALGDAELTVAAYDPTYYTAYGFATQPQIVGREGCDARVWEPDMAAADEALTAAIEEMGGPGAVEVDFPPVGEMFAEEVRLTCAGSS